MRTFVRAIDRLSSACGVLAAVLVIALIILMLYDVVLRYGFNAPTLWGFDVNTWLMGAAFILSIGYALAHDAHVRVDLLYTPATRPRLRYVDVIGFTLILLPASAWNPVLWPFRLILFLGFLAFTLQILAEIIKRLYSIMGRPLVRESDEEQATV